MHLDHVTVPEEYREYIGKKILLLALSLAGLATFLVFAISLGAADLSSSSVVQSLLGFSHSKQVEAIVWNIRLPQALTSIIAGGGLAVSGTVMQAILRNPLGSPYTLGISHSAAFGAAFSVMILGGGTMGSSSVGGFSIAGPCFTTLAAFVCAISAAGLIVAVAQLRGATPEVMVLTGVALGALFTAGTMFLQFFADDMQLAAMVFWSFGDTARATWKELGFASIILAVCFLYFWVNSWNYNAIDSGDETAKGLGVKVTRVRLLGMMLASLLTAVLIAFLGVIGFVGLVVPHMVRKVIGSDHRFLLPASLMAGGLLLLISDTVARLLFAPHVLPVSVLTAFLGAPVFFWLILRRNHL